MKNLQQLKTELLEKLKLDTCQLQLNISHIKTDEIATEYKAGNLTIKQVINSINDKSGITIVKLNDNNFQICDKNQKFPPQSFLNQKTAEKLFDENNKQLLLEVYPELTQLYTNIEKEIKDGNCTNCTKNGKIHQIINELNFLERKKDLDKLIPIFGEDFIEAFREFPVQKKQQQTQQPPKQLTTSKTADKKVNNNGRELINALQKEVAEEIYKEEDKKIFDSILNKGDGPFPSCIQCVMKHLGKAVAYLNEAGTGYRSHKWNAAGELGLASDESLRDFPELANEIREIRHKIIELNQVPLIQNLINRLDKEYFSDK